MANKSNEVVAGKTSFSLLKGTTGALIFKVLGAMAGFGFAVLVARYLGASKAGVYYTALPFVVMGAYLARFGLDQVAMREVAGAAGVGQDLKPLAGNLLTLGALGAMVGGITVALIAPLAANFYGMPDLIWMFPMLAMALVFVAIFNLTGQFLRGLHLIWHSSFVLFAGHNIFSLLILLVFAGNIVISADPLAAAVWAFVLGAGITAMISLYLGYRELHNTVHSEKTIDGLSRSDLLRMGQPLLLYGLGTMAFQWTDTLVLAAVRESDEVAVYNSALRVAQAVGFVLMAVVTTVGPRFAALYRAGRMEELQQTYRRATLLTLLTALPPVLLLWLAGDMVMGVFGEEFRAGALPLAILAAGQLVSALAGPVGQILIAAGREVQLRNLSLGMAALNVLLNLGLAPVWGATGSAVATALSVIALNLGGAIIASRTLGVGLFGWRGKAAP